MLWQDYLNTPEGSAELRAEATWLVPLADYGLIEVAGGKAMEVLQGQCTCDFNTLTQGRIVLGAHCNPKGRMHSTFAAFVQDANTVLLRCHDSIVEHASRQLHKYAVFSRVSVQENTAWQGVAVAGPQALKLASELVGVLAVGQFVAQEDCIALAHSDTLVEFWLRGKVNEVAFSALLALPRQNSSRLFLLHNIRAGIAELQAPLVDTLLPQELNLQAVGAVSFAKGCYTGQEIVARIHYKGQLKKQLYRGLIHTPVPPTLAVGDELIDLESKACGQLINAVIWQENTYYAAEFLALCDDAHVSQQQAYIPCPEPVKIQWLELPYAIS